MGNVNKPYVQCENHDQYKCSATVMHKLFCFTPVTSSINSWLLCRAMSGNTNPVVFALCESKGSVIAARCCVRE